MNQLRSVEYPNDPALDARIKAYELAFRMQMSVPETLDLNSEPKATRDLYGVDDPATRDFGIQIIQHGSTISDQAILNVVMELENASNPNLRREATNLRGVINGDPATRLKYEDQLASTCFKLHLLNGSGAPI